jgi:hypothetical protein
LFELASGTLRHGKKPTMRIFPSDKSMDSGEEYVLRGADDPSDVVLLFKASSLDRARAFLANQSVGDATEKSGVVGKPDAHFPNS